MKFTLASLLALPLLISGCSHSVFADACTHEAPRQATIAVDGATHIRIVAGAGDLEVIGKSGLNSVDAHGTACAVTKSKLDGIQLIAERRGDTLWIESVFEPGWGNGGLSFTVELPDNLPVKVEDGSGQLRIENVATLRLNDGSGSVEIRGVAGDLTVEDGSGTLDIENVAGSIDIDDGSGGLSLRNVDGNVKIVDGSGGLSIGNITGDIRVKDGSGGLDIDNVIGNINVRDGSGSIGVDEVNGNLTISEAGSGSVHYNRVSGQVNVPNDD